MSIKSIWNTFVQNNRDEETLSFYEMRALTNQFEACHGDFAYLPVINSVHAEEFSEENTQNRSMWKTALAR